MNSNLASFSLTSTGMLVSRIFRRIGLGMVALGLLTLLFVIYQLWGTGVLTARYQEGLEDDFEELVEQVEEIESSPDEITTEEDSELDFAEFIWRPEGEAIAQLSIPALDLSKTVVAGVGVEALRKGPGHYSHTSLPGMPGNSALAGHRTTWGAPFGRINDLKPGDEINVQTIQGSFTYRVVEQIGGKGHFIISPYRLDVLEQDFDIYPDRLTLISCHPKLTARNRIVVVAELISEPADYYPPKPGPAFSLSLSFGIEGGNSSATSESPISSNEQPIPPQNSTPEGTPASEIEAPTPNTTIESKPESVRRNTTTSFGEGLDGDRDAMVPTIAWGIAVFMVGFTTLFVGSRWKRWPAYFIGFFPFMAAVAIWFFNLEKTLPS